jgi:hypothetical protein
LKGEFSRSGKNSTQFQDKHLDYKVTKRKYLVLDKLQKKYPSQSMRRKTIKIKYYRFADDWILFTNASKEMTQAFYEKLDEWI